MHIYCFHDNHFILLFLLVFTYVASYNLIFQLIKYIVTLKKIHIVIM
jgi:hypothetical protein